MLCAVVYKIIVVRAGFTPFHSSYVLVEFPGIPVHTSGDAMLPAGVVDSLQKQI